MQWYFIAINQVEMGPRTEGQKEGSVEHLQWTHTGGCAPTVRQCGRAHWSFWSGACGKRWRARRVERGQETPDEHEMFDLCTASCLIFLNMCQVSCHLFSQRRKQQLCAVIPIYAAIVNLVQEINEHNSWQHLHSDTDVIIVASVIGRWRILAASVCCVSVYVCACRCARPPP